MLRLANILNAEVAAGLAENLLRAYATRNGDILPLFAAFVGVVFQRDAAVGRDALTALDRLVMISSGESSSPFV
jgi:hypothetical protein